MSYEDSSRRKGCIILLVLTVLGVVGFYAYSKMALNRNMAKLRALCVPSKLLEVYRNDLFRVRSAETRENPQYRVPNDQWRIESNGGFVVVSSIPLTAKTTYNRLYLMRGQTKVAALKFASIATPPVLMFQSTTIASCNDATNQRFYVDMLDHEFSERR